MDSCNREHDEWFKKEYPNTYADKIKGMNDAILIHAHSVCAWDAAVETLATPTQMEQD